MRCVYAATVCLLAAAAALAAPPVELPKEVSGEVGAFVTLRGKTDGAVVRFVPLDAGLAVFPADLLADKKATVVSAAKPGRYRVLAYSSVKDDPTEPAVVTVVIGGAEPDDVIPPPKPKPPEPKPADGPLRVIFVYETGDSYTTAQQAVLFGDKVRVYLDANAKGWRRFDKDVDAANERDAEIKALWAASKGKVTAVPCVVVASGTAADIVPLPADEAAALELFRKYGGK